MGFNSAFKGLRNHKNGVKVKQTFRTAVGGEEEEL